MKAKLSTDGGARGNPGPAAYGYVLETPDGTVLDARGETIGVATNNVEARLLFVAGEQTSSLLFRLEQLDAVEDTGQELVLRFEERDGIAKLARCTSTGLDVELHHILTFT